MKLPLKQNKYISHKQIAQSIKRLTCAVVVLSIVSLYFPSYAAFAQDEDYLSRFKAISLHKFLNYVRFKDKNNTTTMCIMNDEKVYKAAKLINKSRKGGKKADEILHYENANTDLDNCDLLYLSASNIKDAIRAMGMISSSQNTIITVSDMSDFVRNNGGMIEIFNDKGYIKYGINVRRSDNEDFEFSSKLVESADKVY